MVVFRLSWSSDNPTRNGAAHRGRRGLRSVLAGVRWRYICLCAALVAAAAPVMWYLMHEYQRERVRTLFDRNRIRSVRATISSSR